MSETPQVQAEGVTVPGEGYPTQQQRPRGPEDSGSPTRGGAGGNFPSHPAGGMYMHYPPGGAPPGPPPTGQQQARGGAGKGGQQSQGQQQGFYGGHMPPPGYPSQFQGGPYGTYPPHSGMYGYPPQMAYGMGAPFHGPGAYPMQQQGGPGGAAPAKPTKGGKSGSSSPSKGPKRKGGSQSSDASAEKKKPGDASPSKASSDSGAQKEGYTKSEDGDDDEEEDILADKVSPMRHDFHFYAGDNKEKYMAEARQVVSKILDGEVKSESKADNDGKGGKDQENVDPFLVCTYMNEKLVSAWENETPSVRSRYLSKEEDDRRRFMMEDEIASRHCATLTARAKSPKSANSEANTFFGTAPEETSEAEDSEEQAAKEKDTDGTKKRTARSDADDGEEAKGGGDETAGSPVKKSRSSEQSSTSKDKEDEDVSPKKEEKEVEKILDRRVTNGEKEYLVRWKGLKKDEDTWESLEHLTHCQKEVEAMDKKKDAESPPRITRSRTQE